MEFVPTWQVTCLCGLAIWVVISSVLNLTHLIRSLIQPCVYRRVDSGTGFVLRVQKWKHWSLDVFFSLLSCVVSVPFYTGFLPLLFWATASRMLYQLLDPAVRLFEELLLPKMRRKMLKNMDCLLLTLLTRSAYLGRIYLGMHSLIDVFGGLLMGILILGFWLSVSEFIDSFVVTGRNVTYFWSALSFLMGFVYPTPEFPTPSFEFHTCFNGVALGIVAGVNQSYHHFHHEDVPSLFSQLPFPHFIGRVLVGIPTILLVKLCGKALAKRIVPLALYMTGITLCYQVTSRV